jgi:hypothetical protein
VVVGETAHQMAMETTHRLLFKLSTRQMAAILPLEMKSSFQVIAATTKTVI